jgi:hypothetical protein
MDLPLEIISQICGYERMVFRYVSKFLHNEYLKNTRLVCEKILIRYNDGWVKLDIMTTWYEFAEYLNVALKRIISKTMHGGSHRKDRSELERIYNYAVCFKWNHFHNLIRNFGWFEVDYPVSWREMIENIK